MKPDDLSLGSKYDSWEPVITGPSGRAYSVSDPVLPGRDDLLAEIAYGLGGTNRFGGRTQTQYSVAQHSVLVSRLLFSASVFAVLHDAAEAFLTDLPSPLKKVCPDFCRLETRWMAEICKILRAEPPPVGSRIAEAIARADRVALYVEVLAFDGGVSAAKRLGFDPEAFEKFLGGPASALRAQIVPVLADGSWDRQRASAEWLREYARVAVRRS